MNWHGIKRAGIATGFSLAFTALVVGVVLLGQFLLPGLAGCLASIGVCIFSMFLLIAWDESHG